MTDNKDIHQKYIVVSPNCRWGKGNSLKAALRILRATGGEFDEYHMYRLDSKVRFPDYDKPATYKEADCWVNADGSVSYVRCKCKMLTITKGKRRWIGQ